MSAQQTLVQALTCHQAGRLSEAEALYRQVLVQHPEQPDALHLLGMVRHANGDFPGAQELIRRAIALRPSAAEFHSNLGLVLAAMDRLDESAAAYRAAIRLNPDYPEAHYGLGVVMQRQSNFDEAISAYEHAIARYPDFADAHNNLGNVLRRKEQPLKAIAHYERAAALRPDDAEILSNLGIALHSAGQVQRSIDVLRRALAMKPDLVQGLVNLGTALTDFALLPEAIDCYRKAVDLAPDRPDYHSHLIATMNFEPSTTLTDIRAEHRRWWQRHGRPRAATIRPHVNSADPQRRLRIGYISSDFWDHAAASYFPSLLRHHDHDAFEIICYSNVNKPDAVTAQLRGWASGWRDFYGIQDDQTAELIRSDRIDILVDCMLHSTGNSLPVMARKPAPVQVTWLGYPGSTGLETIDYRITDPQLDPPGMNDEFYSEQSVRLPHCFWCYSSKFEVPPVGAPPLETRGHITFGCPNSFVKVNDVILALWSEILAALPNSRMILVAPPGEPRQRVLARLGVSADRIDFAPRQSRRDYLRLYDRIDLVLDTFTYNGHTTNFDSLWMGVPFVTLAGRAGYSRAGLSLLTNLGLTEFIASSPREYVKLAIQMAEDRSKLAQLRGAPLRTRIEQSPLMDGRSFARDFEQVYRMMWKRWCNRETPKPWPE